jgi:transcriptional regulator with XRE-family HTH domain
MVLGHRIRKLRKQHTRTLDEIAASCGFTKSLLSKIEKGRTVPPVATLTKIAKSLGVSVATLMNEEEGASTVFQQKSKIVPTQFVRTDKGYSFFAFASRRGQKAMQPFLFTAEKGKVKPHALSHAGEEFVYILEGTMKYRVGATQYTLGPGDSLYFDAEEEHEITPVSPVVKYLAIFSEVDRVVRNKQISKNHKKVTS